MIKSRDCISFARGIVGHVPAQKSLSVTGESRFRDLPGRELFLGGNDACTYLDMYPTYFRYVNPGSCCCTIALLDNRWMGRYLSHIRLGMKHIKRLCTHTKTKDLFILVESRNLTCMAKNIRTD